MKGLYNSYSDSLMSQYGYKIFRVGIDAAFSCPNRCSNPNGHGCVYCDSQGARSAYIRALESGYAHNSKFESNIDSVAQSVNINGELSYKIDKEDIESQVKKGIDFLKRRYKAQHFAAYLQSFSNTFAPLDKLSQTYDYIISLYDWEQFIVSTRPDCLDDKKLDLLCSYENEKRKVCLELGLQSGSDELLKAMNRGHSVKCFIDAANKIKSRGLELCVHILTGFPGEKQAELDKTIEVICQVHPHAIKIHNLNIAAQTVLYDKYLEGEVTAPCFTRHIENTIYILRRIPSDIVIERLMCETPSHRLACPRLFPDKNNFLQTLERTMNERMCTQGDLWQR